MHETPARTVLLAPFRARARRDLTTVLGGLAGLYLLAGYGLIWLLGDPVDVDAQGVEHRSFIQFGTYYVDLWRRVLLVGAVGVLCCLPHLHRRGAARRAGAAPRPPRDRRACVLAVDRDPLRHRAARGGRAVEKHIGNIFTKLDLPPSDTHHRRVLAVLRLPG